MVIVRFKIQCVGLYISRVQYNHVSEVRSSTCENLRQRFTIIYYYFPLGNVKCYCRIVCCRKKINCNYTGCVKIKRPNTKTAISQKCVNIFAPNFFSFVQHITAHESVVSCCIYSTYAEIAETST